MENLDIKDFQSVSSVNSQDNILLARQNGYHGKILVDLFKKSVLNGIMPSIRDDIWFIGESSTNVKATGRTPQIEIGYVTSVSSGSQASVKKRYDGVDSEGNPIYLFDFEIPRGKDGIYTDEEGNPIKVDWESVLNKPDWVDSNTKPNYTANEVGALPSDTKFKTINGESVLGEGNIELSSSEGGVGQNYEGFTNAEIFNDYENNIAAGNYSHKEGGARYIEHNLTIYQIYEGNYVYYIYYDDNFDPKEGDVHLISNNLYEVLNVEKKTVSTGSSVTDVADCIVVNYIQKPLFNDSVTSIREIIGVSFGDYSHSEGFGNNSVGNSSHAEGSYNKVSGNYSHVEGLMNFVKGLSSHAEGQENRIFSSASHAEGRSNICLGTQSHAEGFQSIAYRDLSHVEGAAIRVETAGESSKKMLAAQNSEFIRSLYTNTKYFLAFIEGNYIYSNDFINEFVMHASFGLRNHVEGINNICFDNTSHVEGYENRCGAELWINAKKQIDHANHVEGSKNKTGSFMSSVRYSHVEGYDNYLYASSEPILCAHIEGSGNSFKSNNENNVNYVHIEGYSNTIENPSTCYASHLGGRNSKILGGIASFAHGYNVSVINNYEVAFGKFNASEIEGKKVLFSYGIGISDSNRKNAISVFSDGSVSIPNLTGVTGLDEKLAEIENKLNLGLNALQDKILGIYNKLSNGDITDAVFVINDALIITSRIDSIVSENNLAINDKNFIFADGDLSYSVRQGYLTGARNDNGNLIFESTNE